MIDFHNHILPGVDDGSKSLEMSIEMIKSAQKQGITEIVNTTHYKHPKINNSELSNKEIDFKYSELKNSLQNQKINIEIHLGSEVYYHDNLHEMDINDRTTFGNGKFMLIEFPVIQFPKKFHEVLFRLQLNGITPIIAHPERYREIQKNDEILNKFIDQGYVIQVDAGSILGQFGSKTKRCALKIIKKGYFHLIGSDAHNFDRNFCIGDLFDLKLEMINLNVKNIFFNNPMVILEGQSINNLRIDLLKTSRLSNLFKRILKI